VLCGAKTISGLYTETLQSNPNIAPPSACDEDATVIDTTKPKKSVFAAHHCDEVLYRFTVTKDKFKHEALVKAAHQNPKFPDWGDITCPSRESDFHVHIAWREEPNGRLRVQIGHYDEDPEPSLINPTEIIYAEDAMAFIGKFFTNETAHAHIHADFEFGATRISKFPIPMRMSIGASKAEMDTIGFKVLDSPVGVEKIWIAQLKAGLNVQLMAEKRVVFANFSVADDITDWVSAIDSVTEVQQ